MSRTLGKDSTTPNLDNFNSMGPDARKRWLGDVAKDLNGAYLVYDSYSEFYDVFNKQSNRVRRINVVQITDGFDFCDNSMEPEQKENMLKSINEYRATMSRNNCTSARSCNMGPDYDGCIFNDLRSSAEECGRLFEKADEDLSSNKYPGYHRSIDCIKTFNMSEADSICMAEQVTMPDGKGGLMNIRPDIMNMATNHTIPRAAQNKPYDTTYVDPCYLKTFNERVEWAIENIDIMKDKFVRCETMGPGGNGHDYDVVKINTIGDLANLPDGAWEHITHDAETIRNAHGKNVDNLDCVSMTFDDLKDAVDADMDSSFFTHSRPINARNLSDEECKQLSDFTGRVDLDNPSASYDASKVYNITDNPYIGCQHYDLKGKYSLYPDDILDSAYPPLFDKNGDPIMNSLSNSQTSNSQPSVSNSVASNFDLSNQYSGAASQYEDGPDV